MSEEFHKIRRLPHYVFEQVNRLKASARAAGADIIDLGMGNPDLPTPQNIVDKLCEAVQDPRAHRYSASKGIPGLRRAQAQYYARRFGVKLNPDTQVVATLGSKEGFANMAQAITAPGDVVLCPDPTYPIHSFGFIMSGGVIRSVQAKPDDNFIPTLERGVKHSIPKPIALILNFPSNPTAYVATLDFYKDVVAFARKHDIVILSDLAYSEIYFDGNPPPSVLEVPGAMDVTVEFTSMSKTFSMPGWRMGFAVGNERLIAALTRVKSYLDYGAFTPIQVAATAALNGDGSDIAYVRNVYSSAVTCWLKASAALAGMFRHRLPPCLPGFRSRNGSARWVRWNSPNFWWSRPMWLLRRASVLVNMATIMCASRWWKTSIAFVRPRAISSGSFLPRMRTCKM